MQRIVLLLLLLMMIVPAAAQDDEMTPPEVYLTDIWARPTAIEGMDDMEMPAGEVSAAYMVIENPNDTAIRLVAATSPAAEIVEIHETSMENDVMRMNEIEGGLEIPAGETVMLEPGGFHIMLIDLTMPLVDGEALPLSLEFEMGDEMVFTVDTAAVITQEPLENPEQFVVLTTWARPTGVAMGEMEMEGDSDEDMAAMIPPSAAYMILLNRSEEDDALVGARSAAVPMVEVHTTEFENDVMRMREVESIPLPAGERIVLEPGGFHIMLMNLESDLLEGNALPITLLFASGAEMTVAVPVRDEMGMMMDDAG